LLFCGGYSLPVQAEGRVGGCSRRKKSMGAFHDIPFLCGYEAEIFIFICIFFFFLKPSGGAEPGFELELPYSRPARNQLRYAAPY
jgi:hypothetical protein